MSRPALVGSVRALALVTGLVGCERVWGLEGELPCGDGVLAQDESCDDGNLEDGDGCSATCAIEPGFACPPANAGQPCLSVLAFSRGPVKTELPPVGAHPGGTSFSFECAPGALVIGFAGFSDESLGNLGVLSVKCGSFEISTAGDARVTNVVQSASFGTQPSGDLFTALCEPNEVATGFVPRTNDYISGFEWSCQPLSFSDGVMRLGAERSVAFGLPGTLTEARQTCPANEVVTRVSGTVGASVDSIRLGCSVLVPVICGDGVVVAPEVCDDGNAARHDGCDARCQRE